MEEGTLNLLIFFLTVRVFLRKVVNYIFVLFHVCVF